MATSVSISAVIITKNEERNIGRCLHSLAEIADEMIVVDSFSTDKTENICKEKGAKFVQHDWVGYAATKNYANSLAKGDYILSLDADEALSDELRKNLLIHKHKGFKAQAYKFNRLTNYCGKFIHHCGWYPDRKIRLWKKGIASWEGIIHEDIVLEGVTEIGFLKGDILHYSFYSISEHLLQINKFTDLMAANIYNRKKKVPLCKLLFSPFVKFLKSYFIKSGFRDGFYGFVVCILSSMATFLKYAKAMQLYRNNS